MEDTHAEDAFMAAYAAGDVRAFERLFARLAPRVHAFFVRSFGDRALAEDLMQQTFLKLHRARASYQPDRPVRPWLFTIAARLRTDELRRRGRTPEDLDDAPEDRLVGENPSPQDDTDAEDASARVERVRDALSRLSEVQRTILHLHRYEGLTFGQIGDALGLSEGAVKLRAFRAYERLRKELAPLANAALAGGDAE
jgi:RNA polymerase sigma-70 factor (ECF subfamily)